MKVSTKTYVEFKPYVTLREYVCKVHSGSDGHKTTLIAVADVLDRETLSEFDVMPLISVTVPGEVDAVTTMYEKAVARL